MISSQANSTSEGGDGGPPDGRRACTSSSTASSEPQPCEICSELAPKLSPFSGRWLCPNHIREELIRARQMNVSAVDLIQPYMESAGAVRELMQYEKEKLVRRLARLDAVFDSMQASITQWGTRSIQALATRRDRVIACEEAGKVIADREIELAQAQIAGNTEEINRLTVEIAELKQRLQTELAAIEHDYLYGEGSNEAVQKQLDQLSRAQALLTNELKLMEEKGIRRPRNLLPRSHSIEFDDRVEWVAACSDSSGFYGNPDGRVVSIADLTAAGIDDPEAAGCSPLPQPCVIVRVRNLDQLVVASPDGSVRLNSCCQGNQWQDGVCGLHCDRQLLFVGQKSGVTVTDLSGRLIRIIQPPENFSIRGIGGSSHGSLYLAGGNKIAVCAKANGAVQCVVTLDQAPDAELCGVVFHQDCLLATDMKHGRVYRLLADSPHTLTVAHPTRRSGIDHFERPLSAVVDSRNRLYVSESGRDAIRVVSAGVDGAMVGSIELNDPDQDKEPDKDSEQNRQKTQATLNGFPCGLAVVHPSRKRTTRRGIDYKELLAVADMGRKRLTFYVIGMPC